MRKFAITVGRWHGMWAWIWYADVMHESDQVPYTSFNALTKRGVIRKSRRYIVRLTSAIEDKQATIYVFNESTLSLEEMDV